MGQNFFVLMHFFLDIPEKLKTENRKEKNDKTEKNLLTTQTQNAITHASNGGTVRWTTTTWRRIMALENLGSTSLGNFKNVNNLQVKVTKVRKGMDIILDNRILKGKGEDGDYQISISFENMELKTVRRLSGLINELEGMGFEYVPRKRVYRR